MREKRKVKLTITLLFISAITAIQDYKRNSTGHSK